MTEVINSTDSDILDSETVMYDAGNSKEEGIGVGKEILSSLKTALVKHRLTDMQYKFVTAYCSNGFNARQAALTAGYSDHYSRIKSHTLLEHKHIKPHIDKIKTRITVDIEDKLMISLADKCKVLAQIIYDILPQDGSEPKRDHYAKAMQAIDILNKMQGHYMPDKRLNVTVDATKERLIEAKRIYKEF